MGVVCVMGLYLVLSPLMKSRDVGEMTHHSQSGVGVWLSAYTVLIVSIIRAKSWISKKGGGSSWV